MSRRALTNLRFRAVDHVYVQCDPSGLAAAILTTWDKEKKERVQRMTEKEFRRMYAAEVICTSKQFAQRRAQYSVGQHKTHRILSRMSTRFDRITWRIVEILLNPAVRKL